MSGLFWREFVRVMKGSFIAGAVAMPFGVVYGWLRAYHDVPQWTVLIVLAIACPLAYRVKERYLARDRKYPIAPSEP